MIKNTEIEVFKKVSEAVRKIFDSLENIEVYDPNLDMYFWPLEDTDVEFVGMNPEGQGIGILYSVHYSPEIHKITVPYEVLSGDVSVEEWGGSYSFSKRDLYVKQQKALKEHNVEKDRETFEQLKEKYGWS